MPTKQEILRAQRLLGLIRRCVDCGTSIEDRGLLSNACQPCALLRVIRGNKGRHENHRAARAFMRSKSATEARKVRVAFGRCATLGMASKAVGIPDTKARELLRRLFVAEDALGRQSRP